MKNKLKVVPPQHLRAIWHLVRPGLENLVERDLNVGKWIPEDVYAKALKGEVHVALLEMPNEDDEMEYDGFVVLNVIKEMAYSRLHVWIGHSLTGKNFYEAFIDDLNDLAFGSGCSCTTFGSSRKGWEKVAPKFGYEPMEVLYSRQVTPPIQNETDDSLNNQNTQGSANNGQ